MLLNQKQIHKTGPQTPFNIKRYRNLKKCHLPVTYLVFPNEDTYGRLFKDE